MLSRERHVALDVTLTNSEAQELITAIEHYFLDFPEVSAAVLYLAQHMAEKMSEQPDRIVFVDFDSDQVVEDRKYHDEAGDWND